MPFRAPGDPMQESEPASADLLQAIRLRPGASTREIAAMTGNSEWTADYHLRRLAKAGLVMSEMRGRVRCWFLASCGLCPVLRRAMPALRRPEARAVAWASDETPVTAAQLAARAGVSKGSTRWVAGVLTHAFILERSTGGRTSLRAGAQTCIAQATSGQRCALWGKCSVSREWAAAQATATTKAQATTK